MHVWYASYGSNLSRDRFLCYLQGGRPEGATRTYPGARDQSHPAADAPFALPGQVFFGWHSPTWDGGIAFYDRGVGPGAGPRLPHHRGAVRRRRGPGDAPRAGEDLDLSTVLAERRHSVGPGRYESLHLVGELGGHPVITFTSPDDAELPHNPPSEPYLAMVARGLRETHEHSEDELADYLLGCPGVSPHWSRDEVRELLAA